jgi:hypothetical protein
MSISFMHASSRAHCLLHIHKKSGGALQLGALALPRFVHFGVVEPGDGLSACRSPPSLEGNRICSIATA